MDIEKLAEELESIVDVQMAFSAITIQSLEPFGRDGVIVEQHGLLVDLEEMAYLDPDLFNETACDHFENQGSDPFLEFAEEVKNTLIAQGTRVCEVNFTSHPNWKPATSNYLFRIAMACRNAADRISDRIETSKKIETPENFEREVMAATETDGFREHRQALLLQAISLLMAK